MVGTKRPLPPSDQWANELSNSTQKEMQDQTVTGYFYLDSRGEYYRLTWKGTFLMTWKQLWPIKQIRRAMMRRQNRGLLAEWGMLDLLG